MIDNINMTTTKDLMARILEHPLLQDTTIEQCIRYTVDFINIVGFHSIYKNKLANVEIKNHRGVLPCDLIQLVQVMNCKDNEAMKQMTSNFDIYKDYMPAYKVQGKCIFTTFEEGTIKVAYRAMFIDDDGFPMIPDLPIFQKALELYIKCQEFTILFDQQKIPQNVLQHTEQEYAWAVGQLNSDMNTPNIAEMENITNILHQLIPNEHEYKDGFAHIGDSLSLPNKIW